MIRVFVVALAFAVAASTGAMAFGPHQQREADGGCAAGYHRGVGGGCIQNPDSGPYKPDPYWTPCDYSQGPQVPEGCGE
jgi:hypothetical protein